MLQSPIIHDVLPSPEIKISHEIFVGLLTGIANHEAKLATTAIITSQPDVWFGETSLWNEVRARQGDNAGWLPDRKGPIKYCYFSLEPVGLVAKGSVAGERGEVTAFKANDEQPEAVTKGLALSGTLMEWSLQFPDISLQKVFGRTASKGAFRTPEVRYGILRELVDNIGSPLTYMDIARPLINSAIDERNVFASIRELTDNGTLKTRQIDVANDVVLEITGPYQYRGTGLHLDQLSEAAQLTYRAIDLLWERGEKQVNFQAFTAAALEINPQANLPELRQYWYFGSKTEYANMPNFKPLERTMHSPSIVALNPEHSEAIKNLVGRLRHIEEPTSDLSDQLRAGREIIANTVKMSALYAKARKFSANVSGQEESAEVVNGQIISIVVNAKQITTKGVLEALNKTGRRLTEGSISNYLSKLAQNGNLTQEKRKLDPTKKREYIFYSVPEAEKSSKSQ